jgi:hypothetical protein
MINSKNIINKCIGKNREYFINAYTGKRFNTLKGLEKSISPPWLKGAWHRESTRKKVNSTYYYMFKYRE